MNWRTTQVLGAISVAPLAVAPASTVALQAPPAGQETSVWTFHHEGVLGTSLQVNVRAADKKTAVHAEVAALAVFDREEAILSAWKPESEFSRWSRTRFKPIRVSEDLFSVLAAFDAWRDRTDGALDPSVEAATRLWKRTTAEGRVPTGREIAETREAMAQPHWSLNAEHRTATKLSDVPLALASFTKSWITSKAADAALEAGASGVTLNVGGDVVVRGAMMQIVDIANPDSAADNDPALEHVVVADRTVATSGGYRRGFKRAGEHAARKPEFSHIIDPRTARPTGHVLSSTVIARDTETAGALATAFAVLPQSESQRLADEIGGVEYLLVMLDGQQVRSPGWMKYRIPHRTTARFQPASYVLPAKAAAGAWNVSFELAIELNLPRINDARYRRPYVAVWIEDADHFPVRTLALWTQNPRWLPELKQWYRDDQIRNLSEGTDISRAVSSATRPPGAYTLKWDGKDNDGRLVRAGNYTVVMEASREHGGYQVERKEMSFSGKPEQVVLPAGQELGAITLDYRKR